MIIKGRARCRVRTWTALRPVRWRVECWTCRYYYPTVSSSPTKQGDNAAWSASQAGSVREYGPTVAAPSEHRWQCSFALDQYTCQVVELVVHVSEARQSVKHLCSLTIWWAVQVPWWRRAHLHTGDRRSPAARHASDTTSTHRPRTQARSACATLTHWSKVLHPTRRRELRWRLMEGMGGARNMLLPARLGSRLC